MKRRTDIVKDKNLMVVGVGKTGISVIKKLLGICSSIVAVDSNPDVDIRDLFKGVKQENRKSLKVVTGKDISKLDKGEIAGKIDLVVASPGILGDMPLIKIADENGIPVLSEIELAWRLLDSGERKKTIAVTGTNGKTTVVNLIGKIFTDSGRKCIVCGNVGLPLIDTINITDSGNMLPGVPIDKDLTRVIEVSSFQLERTYEFKPHISIILNITSDHLDRHGTFENYGSLKLKLLKNQDKKDSAVVNMDDRYLSKKTKLIPGGKKQIPVFIRYGMEPKNNRNIFYDDNCILYRIGKKEGKINIRDVFLKGNHNISNIMASSAAALLAGITRREIEKAVSGFRPLGHRLEYLGYVNGIRCFNDSKSTNPDATAAALSSFGKEVTLILGGRDKDMDFSELIGILNKKIKNLILIGESTGRIYKQVRKNTYDYGIFKCGTLEEAVNAGFKAAKQDEVLLLSPGCASMDMFRDYRDRGDKFKKLVLERKIG
jgi:UDP-N-acetylmuramoylalanine--D-glutamate ligase